VVGIIYPKCRSSGNYEVCEWIIEGEENVQRRADGGMLDACKKSKTRSLVVLLTNRKDYGHFEVIVFFEINAVV